MADLGRYRSCRKAFHDTISTYGIGRDHSHDYWVSIFRQLIHKG
ncbi:RQC domain-containing protein, partial [Phosphitispora fastidiosa]